MGLAPFQNIYAGKKILLTGHTGFKGSWLTQWLTDLGATVYGISHPDSTNTLHWSALNLDIKDLSCDIADKKAVAVFTKEINPHIIFHLAAQALVRDSYQDPIGTWQTNVIGTGNVLDAARYCNNLQAIVVVTTDKCYRNNEWVWGYRETDHLGGHDPYSASKAGAELITASYRSSFFAASGAPLVATARAGNVIGGGDWSRDRLIPDAVRAVERGESLVIRSPQATRPWQHVLECLSGYLLLGQRLLQGDKSCAEAFNFGPDDAGNVTVENVLKLLQSSWPDLKWTHDKSNQPHEAKLLMLDCSKARRELQWQPVWNIEETARMTASWYEDFRAEKKIQTLAQIKQYTGDASAKNLIWAA